MLSRGERKISFVGIDFGKVRDISWNPALSPKNVHKLNLFIYQYFTIIPHAKVKLDKRMRLFANNLIYEFGDAKR